jgi:threonine dehydrogenase-like Zn-dependent dehydrogenase
MRQAVMTSPGTIELRTVADVTAGPGQVLMRIRRIGVCGSDVHVNHGKHPFVMMYRREDYETAVAWIADGSIRTEPLSSRHFPLERCADAYRCIDEQG